MPSRLAVSSAPTGPIMLSRAMLARVISNGMVGMSDLPAQAQVVGVGKSKRYATCGEVIALILRARGSGVRWSPRPSSQPSAVHPDGPRPRREARQLIHADQSQLSLPVIVFNGSDTLFIL